ncbi:MAG: AprI/Inh family metalloprotease inhibitor [Hyphomicrobiales bacterium]|nr:AprI/Inh family metalloprotease inhibitor [Hyphomicrobiales bacterium]
MAELEILDEDGHTMNRLPTLAALGAVSFLLSACGGFYDVPPLTPAPREPVAASNLPPLDEPGMETGEQYPDDELRGSTDPSATDVADGTLPDGAGGPPARTANVTLDKDQMAGGWKIASGGTSCGLFLSTTTWTGGHRASTRGCADDELRGISAWDVNGNQIILKGEGGAEVARLYATGNNRFSGATATSRGVSVFR